MDRPPPPTTNSITYDDYHLSIIGDTYIHPHGVQQYVRDSAQKLEQTKELVALANIQPGEKVLDLACGTGQVGLLVQEVAGVSVNDVYFLDCSSTMTAMAVTELKRRGRHVPRNVASLKDVRMPEAVNAVSKNWGGFDVVILCDFANQFTFATQHALIHHAASFLRLASQSPNRRVITTFAPPGPSRAYRGKDNEAMMLGVTDLRTSSIDHFYDLES